jgi:hypothetical protein
MLRALDVTAAGATSQSQLTVYASLLVIAGVIAILLAASGVGHAPMAERAVAGVIGAAFLSYGIYLFLFFDGTGTVYVFWYAFIAPMALVALAIRRLVT